MKHRALPLVLSLLASTAMAQDLPTPFPGSAAPPEPAPPTAPPEPAPPTAPPEPMPVAAPLAPPIEPAPPVPAPPGPPAMIRPFGYVRTLFSMIADDGKNTDFVGQYDGFQMANARLGVEVTKNHTRAVISVDGAVDRRDDLNTSQGTVEVRLRDAFAEWKPCTGFKATAGQFEVPFDAEELTSNTDLVFVDQGVESRGVRGVEGYNVDGLSLDREVGLLLSSDPIYFMPDGFGLTYALAITNGSSAAHPLNDNESLAYTGRLELLWAKMFAIGVAANLNKVSSGLPPDRLTEDQFSLAADLRADLYGAHFLGQFMRRESTPKDVPSEPDVVGQGFHVQIAYDAPFGLTPGYRYGQFDPTADVQVEDPVSAERLDQDEVKVHTLGLSWAVPEEPLTIKVNYHVILEDDARKLANNRLDLLFQGVF